MVDLWLLCRSGMGGFAHLPDGGAILDQGAWIMDAFLICAGTGAWLDREMPLRRAAARTSPDGP